MNVIYIISDGEGIFPYEKKEDAIKHVKSHVGENEGTVWCDEINLKDLSKKEVC